MITLEAVMENLQQVQAMRLACAAASSPIGTPWRCPCCTSVSRTKKRQRSSQPRQNHECYEQCCRSWCHAPQELLGCNLLLTAVLPFILPGEWCCPPYHQPFTPLRHSRGKAAPPAIAPEPYLVPLFLPLLLVAHHPCLPGVSSHPCRLFSSLAQLSGR